MTFVFSEIAGLIAISALLIISFILWAIDASDYDEQCRISLKKFSIKNGFIFKAHGAAIGPGTIFEHGRDKSTYNIVSGEYCGFQFRYFSYKYIKGGKNERAYDQTIMELELPKKFPHMVIDSLVE